MKKVTVKVMTISSQIFVVFLFLLVFSFDNRQSSKNLAINNDNFSKMADTVSILFEEEENSKIVDESIVLPLTDEKNEEEIEEEVTEDSNDNISLESTSNVVSLDPVVLDTVVGNLTGYGANCYGCSGTTTSGFDLTKSIYYDDYEYGTIRIVAADPSFPLYSIFRISNVPNMEPFIVIVLDRGSNVGFGRGTLFDLAYFTEEDPDLIGLTHNVTFELLRRGK